MKAQLAGIKDGQAAMHNDMLAGFARVEASLDAVQALARVNKTLLTAAVTDEHDAPCLFFPVPEQPAGGWRAQLRPKSWFNNTIRIHLICAHGLHVVPCGPDGNGYELLQRKNWVVEWAPVLAATLAVARTALAGGRVCGLPLPYVPAVPGVAKLNPTMENAAAVAQLQLRAVDEMLEDVKEAAPSAGGAIAAMGDTAAGHAAAAELPAEVQALTGAAYRAFRAFLHELDPSLQHTGLEKAVSEHDGTVAWVAPDKVAAWREQRGATSTAAAVTAAPVAAQLTDTAVATGSNVVYSSVVLRFLTASKKWKKRFLVLVAHGGGVFVLEQRDAEGAPVKQSLSFGAGAELRVRVGGASGRKSSSAGAATAPPRENRFTVASGDDKAWQLAAESAAETERWLEELEEAGAGVVAAQADTVAPAPAPEQADTVAPAPAPEQAGTVAPAPAPAAEPAPQPAPELVPAPGLATLEPSARRAVKALFTKIKEGKLELDHPMTSNWVSDDVPLTFGGAGIAALAQALAGSQVTSLCLRRTSAAEVTALAQALPNLPLTKLVLRDHMFQGAEWAAFAQGLAGSKVTTLDLGNFQKRPEAETGDVGVTALAQSLADSQLASLMLLNLNIGSAGSTALAHSLTGSQVTDLDLCVNTIGDAGTMVLAQALPGSQIKRLGLCRVGMGDVGAIAVARALPDSQLEYLGLCGNAICDA
eukprot:g6692.t1